ncbi:MAG: translation initiation factor IF-2 [Candidatus Latescibacter sp.]|nr:translation initiation factor IF-2 [Candidatus Latescibacter sp.]
MEKKRVYQVAKDFHISSEALVSMLKELKFDVKSHMSIVTNEMHDNIKRQFEKQHEAAVKDIEKKTKIVDAIEKKVPEGVVEKPAPSKRRKKRRRQQKPETEEHKAAQPVQKARPVQKVKASLKERSPKTQKEYLEEKKSRAKSRKRKKKVDMAVVQDTFKKTLVSISTDTRKQKKSHPRRAVKDAVEEDQNIVKVSEYVSVAELAVQMGVPVNALVAKCLQMGMLVSINQRLDMDTIVLLADEFGFTVEQLGEYAEDELITREREEEEEEKKIPRPPVVTVMGHVDHGKTSLLDRIRNSNITGSESGGITQHIGAYSVTLPKGPKITFIDTPGHKAFTAMRARGAQVTDIVILVVAADDSVMPQTIEAIDHAKAAGVPIIIAINKIDLPGADPEKIRSDLSRHNILVEDWGGSFQCQEISAKKGVNIERLLEKVVLEAEILELKADPTKKANGVIIDSKLDRGRGALATVLIQNGTLHVGDSFITGMITGRVRAMVNEFGGRISSAGPSQPVLIFGMDGVPKAGDTFHIVDSEVEAREIAQRRRVMKREQDFRRLKRITLSDIYDKIKDGEIKDLNLIIKADVDGSVEALSDSLSQITHQEVRVRIIHQGVGGINENDVLLAAASGAIIIGFHIRPTHAARALAENENVEIKLYEVIYEVLDDVKNALSGLLAPKITEKIIGTAEIRNMFRVPKYGNIAGCYVTFGTIKRNNKVRLIRDNIEVYTTKIGSLKRFKEDVSEVNQGYECGISIVGYDDFKLGDIFESIEMIEEARTL